MSETNDITIVYYTANRISQYFATHTLKNLIKVANGIPIIAVSQLPLPASYDYFTIVIGDIGQSYLNIYKQALQGAKAAKTKYIALAEDDILYGSDHFINRPNPGKFAYDMNVQAIYTWVKPPIFSRKNRRNLYTLICERELFIEAMEERFAKYPDESNINLGYWSEPGKYEKYLGVTVRETEQFFSAVPNVAFSHENAVSYQNLGNRKKLGDQRTEEIPYWGKASDIMKLYA